MQCRTRLLCRFFFSLSHFLFFCLVWNKSNRCTEIILQRINLGHGSIAIYIAQTLLDFIVSTVRTRLNEIYLVFSGLLDKFNYQCSQALCRAAMTQNRFKNIRLEVIV